MKKFSKLLLMSVMALGLGFSACNNDDLPTNGVDTQEGNTHVSVSLRLAKGTDLRALPNDYNEVGTWAGNDVISSINIYIIGDGAVVSREYGVGEGKAYAYENNSIVPKTVDAAIRTNPGDKEVYVLVNATKAAKDHLDKVLTSPIAFKKAYEEEVIKLANSGTELTVSTSASKLANVSEEKDNITMTVVKPGTLTVAEGVTANEAIAPTAAKNRVTVEVERAVARVMVTTDKKEYTVKAANGTDILGTVSNITWVLAQGENSLNVQRKADWMTPNWDFVPASSEAYWTGAADKYDYSGLFENYNAATQFGGIEVPTLTDYANANATSIGDKSILDGKFVLPTTHEVATGDASSFKKGNTVYAMIRAQFTPAKFADGGTYTAGQDFYLGANGQFYKTAEAAAYGAGGITPQKVTKYVGGKVIYYAWANPDDITGNWYNSPVVRNNIYHIHINGFKTIGTNWNPLFPEDPNNPTLVDREIPDPEDPSKTITVKVPSNPDPKPVVEVPSDPSDPTSPKVPVEEPENPIDPKDPLTTPETFMSVDVTVLPWLVHSYKVELGI